MTPPHAELPVQVVRFVDEYQPGVVACEFVDADGRCHTLIGKVPIFSSADLLAASEYPLSGAARCIVLSQYRDATGRDLAKISLAKPDGLESTEGLSEFVVLLAEVSIPSDRTS